MADDVDDPSVWVKFRLTDVAAVSAVFGGVSVEVPASLVIWTTTPWTLGANVAVAVNPDASYSLVKAPAQHRGGADELFVVATDLVAATFGEAAHSVATATGRELSGLLYAPIFSHGSDVDAAQAGAWRVIADDFVSLGDGTGLVHIAPAYGDLDVGATHGLPTVFSVNQQGEVMPGVGPLFDVEESLPIQGMFFKAADASITAMMDAAGVLYRGERTTHAYPLCWRDDTPLLFFAKNSWYVKTSAVKDHLVAVNAERINWVPPHIGVGRFGNWLENNVDWAISRERYWGTPLPIWIAEDGSESVCIGSVAELAELSGRDLSELDLHRPYVDEITFEQDGKVFRRVPYVLDAWFDSGSMPLAQWHYPFENAEAIASRFPADFICEAIDQTRGWFYSLHAIATMLTAPADAATGRPAGALHDLVGQQPAFKNVVVTGHINDAEGRKMSKSRGNTVDPWEVINEVGVDALRWYILNNGPTSQPISFDINGLRDAQRGYLMTWWSSYAFFCTYAALDKPDLAGVRNSATRPVLDQWLVSRTQTLVATVTDAYEAYDLNAVARALESFVVDDLSNWYIRLSRPRFWQNPDAADQASAYQTLFDALVAVAQLAAPLTPFVAEEMWSNLGPALGSEHQSVHLSAWPTAVAADVNSQLEASMDAVRRVVDLGRAARAASELRVRQPLGKMLVRVADERAMAAVEELQQLIMTELNVRQLEVLPLDSELVSYAVKANFKVLGPRLGEHLGAFRQLVETADAQWLAQEIQAGNNVTFAVGGADMVFGPDDFILQAKKPDGYATAEDGAWLVALDTRLTPELITEGVARDVIRLVQSARKSADLDVSDRIVVSLTPSDGQAGLPSAVDSYLDRITRETLADALSATPLGDAEYTELVDIQDASYSLALRRA
jgi:isoleucyl-tRNA synthetase